MQTYNARTPFGARSLTRAQIDAQKSVDAAPSDAFVHKWEVFRDLTAAKARLGLSDRALAILDALLPFHPEVTLTGPSIVVWPSNAILCLRAHGIAEPTLRRHIALLVEKGIVVRRDSPNGKRYARKGDGGEVEQAFGFDLAPLVARASEFKGLADAVRADDKALRLARERVTICRRDITKLLAAAAEEEGLDGRWADLHEAYRTIMAGLPRRAGLSDTVPVAGALADLANEIYKLLETKELQEKENGNADRFERHIQNSKTETPIELEPTIDTMAGPNHGGNVTSMARKREPYPLSLVLDACPALSDYARGDIETWRQFEATAAFVRPILGISASAFEEAEEVLGSRDAAVVLAAMLQRVDAIASPGGYLRTLVRKARDGQFTIGPMIMALLSKHAKRRSA